MLSLLFIVPNFLFPSLCSLSFIKVPSDLDKLRGYSPSLPLRVGNLELFANEPVPLLVYVTLVDDAFWICYHRTFWVSMMF